DALAVAGSIWPDRAGGRVVQAAGRWRHLPAADHATRAGPSHPAASIGLEPARTTATQDLQGSSARCVDNLSRELYGFPRKIKSRSPNLRKSGQLAKVGMRRFDNRQPTLFLVVFNRLRHGQEVGIRGLFHRQFYHAISQPLVRWELP